jgi:PEGA domain
VVVLLAGGLLFYSRGEHPKPSEDVVVTDPPKAPTNSITLEVFGGTADVYEKGQRVGSTPYTIQRPLGDTVDVILKREGYEDLPVQLDVTERQHYSYTMDAVKR